jgi:transposase-like protein
MTGEDASLATAIQHGVNGNDVACLENAHLVGRVVHLITGVERRRRWRLEQKLRIVAETEQPGSGIAEIARRYEISRGLLWNWRRQVRRGVLKPEPPPVFLPVQTISDSATEDDAKHVSPSATAGAEQVSGGKIEITLPDGTSVKVGHDVGMARLRRVMTVLRR